MSYNGVRGAFMPEHYARKVITDYALLRFYRAENIVMHQRILEHERLQAMQEAENRSLFYDLSDCSEALEISQSQTATMERLYRAEVKDNKRTVVKIVAGAVAGVVGAAVTGYVAGRFIR